MKHQAVIRRADIEKIRIFINVHGWSVPRAAAMTGADYAITGTFYNRHFEAVCHLKADGVVYADDRSYKSDGYAWDEAADFGLARALPPSEKANYYTAVPLIADGKPNETLYYRPDVGGKRGRTAIAELGDKLLLYACTDGDDALTPEALRDYLAGLGVSSAVMGDGGGKVNFYAPGTVITGKDVSQNLLLIWLKDKSGDTEKQEGEKRMKVYLSPSSQPGNVYTGCATNEQVQCNRIAEAARVALERCGFQVKKAPEGQAYKANVVESNYWGADYHIPIHTNAGGGRGPVVFVYGLTSARKKVAEPVLAALNAIVPVPSSYGVRTNAGLYEVSNTSGTCIYCECAFHDDAQEAAWIVANADKLGEAIAKGLCAGTGVAYVAPEPETEPEASEEVSGAVCPHCGGGLKIMKED